jgi:hypothetical protein
VLYSERRIEVLMWWNVTIERVGWMRETAGWKSPIAPAASWERRIREGTWENTRPREGGWGEEEME